MCVGARARTQLNKLDLIIRSHECEDLGYKIWFRQRLYTIFSASDYCGDSGNHGAYCVLSDAPQPKIKLFFAKRQVMTATERQRRLEKNVLSRLLVRAVQQLPQIEARLRAFAEKKDPKNKRMVSRLIWSHVVREELELKSPLLQLADRFGVRCPKPNDKVGTLEAGRGARPERSV